MGLLGFVSRVSFCRINCAIYIYAESYSTCVLSYDTVSQSLQHVCKHSAKTVIQMCTLSFEKFDVLYVNQSGWILMTCV